MQCRPVFLLLVLPVLLFIAGCREKDGEESTPSDGKAPAANPSDRIVRISEEQQKEFGIEVSIADKRLLQRTLETTGWLQLPPGREFLVRSPNAGFFTPLPPNAALEVGLHVSEGKLVGQVQSVLSPIESIQLVLAKEEADSVIGQSTASLKIAEEQLRALQANDATGAVSGTRMQQLRETIAQATAAINESKQKLPFLPEEPYDKGFQLKPIDVNWPQSGIISEVLVAPKQYVSAGDPLFRVVQLDPLWLKVPLFESDFLRVPTDSPASLTPLAADVHNLEPVTAQPVDHPMEASSATRTRSKYFRLPNSDGAYRAGQAVRVSLPIDQSSEEIVIPRAALIWDASGSSWVYRKQSPDTFQRVRVEVIRTVGEFIAVRRGVNAGDAVATRGTQSIFGEEFRNDIRSEDND